MVEIALYWKRGQRRSSVLIRRNEGVKAPKKAFERREK
jgi:hypothetical protein